MTLDPHSKQKRPIKIHAIEETLQKDNFNKTKAFSRFIIPIKSHIHLT
jgi:hypothetical protein